MSDPHGGPAGRPNSGVARHESGVRLVVCAAPLAPATHSATPRPASPTTATTFRTAQHSLSTGHGCQPATRAKPRHITSHPTRLEATHHLPPRPRHLSPARFASPPPTFSTTVLALPLPQQIRAVAPRTHAARPHHTSLARRHRRHGPIAARRRREGPAGGGAAAAAARARGGAGVGAVDRAGLRGRQRRPVRRGHVRQQLPRARARRPRQQVRRRGVPPPLRLPAARPEPAPRALLRHIAEAGSARVGQGGARAPGVEAPDVHLAPRRRRPPARQYAQPRARRAQARAAVRIREGGHHLPHLRRGGQRDVVAVHQRQHLRGRLRCALRPPRSHAVGALHQLDHLHQQGGGAGDAGVGDRGEPGDRHPAARGQLRAHRGVPHGLPPRLRAPHAPALRLGAALRAAVLRQGRRPEVPGLPVGSARRRLRHRRHRVGGWDGDAVPRGERERALPVVPLPQLRAHRQMELREMK